MNYKELLFNKDKALTFYPELAVILNDYDKYLVKIGYEINGKKWKSKQCGLNAAIIVNQINYWNELNEKLGSKKHFKDGYYWTYHAYDKWAKEDFPFWSGDTVRRSVKFLEDIGLVISTNEYNSWAADNTKWYRIDFENLQEIINIVEEFRKEKQKDDTEKQVADTVNADCDCVMASCIDGLGSMPKAVPEITNRYYQNIDYSTENTKAETLSNDNAEADTISLKKSLPTSDKKKTKSELMELEVDMCRRFLNIGRQYDVSSTALKNIVNAFTRYSSKYTEITGKIHPILRDETLEKIFVTLATISDKEYGHFENVADYEPDSNGVSYLDEMVDEHFNSNHAGSTDLHISHFAKQDYLEKMAQHVVEW